MEMMRSVQQQMGSGQGHDGKGIAAIVGVGPGLGRSIARKFAHEGYTVAILSRDLVRLSTLAEEIAIEGKKGRVFAIRIDCSDSRSVREAFEGVLSLGFVEVLIYNASSSAASPHPTSVIDIPVASFEKSLAISSVGAFYCAQQVLPGMVERGRGTIFFTGCSASLNGLPGFSQLCNYTYIHIYILSLIFCCLVNLLHLWVGYIYNVQGCGKFALRGLSQCLSKELQPLGVHVAHIILHGLVSTPADGSLLDPDSVAQTYWHLHIQDKRAWTHEIDLCPPPPPASATTVPPQPQPPPPPLALVISSIDQPNC